MSFREYIVETFQLLSELSVRRALAQGKRLSMMAGKSNDRWSTATKKAVSQVTNKGFINKSQQLAKKAT